MRYINWRPTVLLLALAACSSDQPDQSATEVTEPSAEQPSRADLIGSNGDDVISPEELESGRLDQGWRRVVQLDSIAAGDSVANSETWESISPQAVNVQATQLPLYGDVAGPSVLTTQILLDRALFSPGAIDGRWGKNTEKALYWLQKREGLRATGRVDRQTFERLVQLAGQPTELIRTHQLTAEDVKGPFIKLPEDIYERAKLECMCYESLTEKLAETYHVTPEVLKKLNPGVALDGLKAGDRINVPNVRDSNAGQATKAARLVVSDAGYYLHALDANGRILYHFPTTLGSSYSPSPSGDYKITNIARDPTWHYQPDILQGVPDDEEDTIIPPGPNNAVGVVWMALSKPHFGIHGTSAPETIGYTTSNGCVRLTNWDARFLSSRIEPGIPVEFRDVDNQGSSAP